jgi:DNA polymerase-1
MLAKFNRGVFRESLPEIQREIQELVGKEMGGKAVNPGSSQQISVLLYHKLQLQNKGGTHRAKKGGGTRSTANEVLKRYVDLHPVVQKIIDWRGYQKPKSTYVDAIPKLAKEDGRIHTNLRITRVATGRLSSAKPNLMAQPVRSEEGRRIRDCYVAPAGCVLVSGDYSAIEMKTVASVSEDLKMLNIFWTGGDIHSQTAADMFGIPLEEVDSLKHRYPAKRIGFGILYMITAQGLQRELAADGIHWTVQECEEKIHSWFKIYSGVAAYMKANGEFAKRYGYVVDMWGRRRYIPGIRSQNKWVRLEAERQAGNAPIQMGAQGIIKEAMGRLVPVYKELGIKPLLQIHDDILWEMPESIVDEAIPIINKIMCSSVPPGFLAPVSVDFKVGKRWGSMEKW